MRQHTRMHTRRLGASLAVLAVFAAACGDDDETTSAVTTAAPSGTEAPSGTTESMSLKAAGCPDPLVIQTDWFPEADHGWTYELIGQNGTLDAKAGKYSGPVDDITVEIRAGGPFVGFSSPSSQMYQDPSVFMAYVDTGDAIRNATTQPVVAVFASYDKGPQIIQWDPAKYPDVKTIADIGAAAGDGKILYFESAAYMDYLIGKEILKKEQVDASYDGSPGRFVAEGDLFQQGFATNEPYSYENLIEDWKKPVAFTLVHDTGFAIYQSALSVKPEAVAANADCLKAIVPMFQQALVDYMTTPGPTNSKLTEIVTEMAQFWQLSDELNNDATAKMKDLGLVSDAGNGTVGDMDCARVQTLIDEFNPILKANNVEGVKDDLKCEEIVDNSFLDPAIGLGF
ncbi:MAG: hypothetical protein FD127_3306 [Acidimicrobiaceae bacterium]|nr:MAG: hypothetical protein FD127_3306 [Acidimicrobiaceae bacterium]